MPTSSSFSAPVAVVIALLGDREAHDARVRMRDALEHGSWVFGRHQHVEQVAHDLQQLARAAVFGRIAQRQRVEAGLRLQCVARVGRAQRHAHRAPAQVVARMQRGFVHHRQVRAMEGADTQVDDARAQRLPPVARHRDMRGHVGQGVGMKARHGFFRAHQFQSVPSCCRRFTGR
jgi:hypothetical protein